MKNTIRLNERELTRIIKRMVNEFEDPSSFMKADQNYERIHGSRMRNKEVTLESLKSMIEDLTERVEDLENGDDSIGHYGI